MRKVLQKGIVGACVISMTVAPSYAKLTQLTIAGIASQKKASVSETKKVTEMQTLNEVLTGLSKSLNVHFIFVDDDLANKLVIAPAFSGKKSDKASLEKTLDDLLASYSLTSKKISEKQYVISRLTEPVNTTEKEESIVVVPTITTVTPDVTVKNDVIDEKVVSGTVTDAVDGSPLPGASVSVKGSSIGTSTDVNGKYSLKVPSETAVLVISYLGYNAKEVTVGTNTTINVHLTPNSKGLQEVIVVAYGTQKKASVIGSVANLSSKAFENSPRVSAQESLQGNVAGVQASNGSGQPGSVPSIRIRGIGSINASSSPLYVIDGVPVVADDLTSYNTNTIAGLNSSDIESISVLKDATAASLYGSRAANGVILITTKSGKAGKTRFNASFQQGVNRLTNSDATKPLNTTEALELIREGWLNSGKTAADFDAEIIKQKINSSVNTDWRNELTRAGNYNQFDLSASGGSEKTTYFLSGGYYDAKAPLKGVDYKRTTARVTLNTQATERLSFNSNLSFSYQKSNTVSDAGAFANPVRAMYRLQPWLTVYNNDGSYNFSYNSGHNPVATINETYRRGTSSAFLGKIGGKYKFADFLMFESNASLDYNNAGIDRFQSPLFGDGKNVNGRSLTGTDVWQNWNTTNILRFNKVLDEKHNLSAFVGYEAQRITGKGSATEYTNLLPGKTSPATGSTPQNVTPLNTESTLTGLFLSANYGYNDRYLMSASVRRDGSSRFGANKRYGTFWSLGAAWNIHNESFMKDVNLVSELKLRSSYGVNGNQGISNFAARGLFGSGYDYDSQPGYIQTQFANNNLTWEENRPFNVGLDFGIFKDRISGTVEYYERSTTKLLLDVSASAINGLTSYSDNYGSMKNSGIEMSLTTHNIRPDEARGFSWKTDLNFSTLKNRITGLVNPMTGTFNREVGLDFYQFYMVGYAGVDPQTGESLFYVDGTKSATTKDYTQAQRFNQGSALPKFFGGITNSFSYKGVELSFQFYMNWGNKLRNGWGTSQESDGGDKFSSTGSVTRYTYEHRWQKPGDVTDVPRFLYGGPTAESSTRFLLDGSYVRLRDVSLTYTLPATFTNKFKTDKVRLYVRGNNLWTYIKDKRLIFDPEVPIEGNLDQRAPVYKTVLMGLDISF